MARGQSQAADKNLAKTNAVGDASQSSANALESKVIPGYTSLMDTGYLSPEDKNAATVSEMGSATQPFESMNFKQANNAAVTRNDSNLTAGQDQLALEEGRTAGDAAAKLQEEQMKNQEAGMYGLTNLKSQDQQEAEHMYGLGPSTLSARAAGKSGDENALGWAQFGAKAAGVGV
ncbi:MAG TPA: hypothetical protein VHV32_19395 [Candidatus Angelobacter sp.]|jgi:hypothetical protein|nr:hypothetical protein [Candidatus Angelobacter sp.]